MKIKTKFLITWRFLVSIYWNLKCINKTGIIITCTCFMKNNAEITKLQNRNKEIRIDLKSTWINNYEILKEQDFHTIPNNFFCGRHLGSCLMHFIVLLVHIYTLIERIINFSIKKNCLGKHFVRRCAIFIRVFWRSKIWS